MINSTLLFHGGFRYVLSYPVMQCRSSIFKVGPAQPAPPPVVTSNNSDWFCPKFRHAVMIPSHWQTFRGCQSLLEFFDDLPDLICVLEARKGGSSVRWWVCILKLGRLILMKTFNNCIKMRLAWAVLEARKGGSRGFCFNFGFGYEI